MIVYDSTQNYAFIGKDKNQKSPPNSGKLFIGLTTKPGT